MLIGLFLGFPHGLSAIALFGGKINNWVLAAGFQNSSHLRKAKGKYSAEGVVWMYLFSAFSTS